MSIQITLNSVGKKFGSEWIFRKLNYEIVANDKLVILGSNGSGKSTLLQVLSGFVSPNEGEIIYNQNKEKILIDDVRKHISFASPYLQLTEDFTLDETVEHAVIFKPFVNKLSVNEIIEIIELNHAKGKFIKQFSSGMKQRLKLGLAILANTGLLLLDEPVSNLDKQAIGWYRNLIQKYSDNRTIIVCSNSIEEEFFFCTRQLQVEDFKAVVKAR